MVLKTVHSNKIFGDKIPACLTKGVLHSSAYIQQMMRPGAVHTCSNIYVGIIVKFLCFGE